MLPTVAKIQDSPPIEEVALIRDEVANMVWGVERTIPLATGDPKHGLEAARQTRAYFEAIVAAQPDGALPPRVPARPLRSATR